MEAAENDSVVSHSSHSPCYYKTGDTNRKRHQSQFAELDVHNCVLPETSAPTPLRGAADEGVRRHESWLTSTNRPPAPAAVTCPKRQLLRGEKPPREASARFTT